MFHALSACVMDRVNKEPLLFAKVEVEGTSDSAVADANGCFVLMIPSELLKKRVHLVINYLGYEPFRYRVRGSDPRHRRTFKLRRAKVGFSKPPVIRLKR